MAIAKANKASTTGGGDVSSYLPTRTPAATTPNAGATQPGNGNTQLGNTMKPGGQSDPFASPDLNWQQKLLKSVAPWAYSSPSLKSITSQASQPNDEIKIKSLPAFNMPQNQKMLTPQLNFSSGGGATLR